MRTWHHPAVRGCAVAAVCVSAVVAGCSGDDADGGESSTTASASATSEPGTAGTPSAAPSESGSGSGSGSGAGAGAGSGSAGSGAPATPTGVAMGALVAGFPADVIQVLADATITVSTVVPADGSRMVSLSGTTALPADQVLSFYRTSLVGQGFVESAGGQAAGFPTATFSRGNGADLLVVAVSTVEGVQTFTVGGTLAG